MVKLLTIGALIAVMMTAGSASARDDRKLFSVDDALNSPEAKDKIDPNVKLYFGDQKHPKVTKEIGEWKTNKKTNAFNKPEKESCNWAFISAVLEMQNRARGEGGNAIIQIKSNYKNIEANSETEFTCGVGSFMSGVALKGKVVKMGK